MVTSQYNCHIFAWHIKLQKMQATKHNTFLMFLCKDSRACSKSAILFSCSLTTEQQLWHFVTHNSSGYKVLKELPNILRCLVFIQWHWSNWLHIWHRMGLLHTTCCKRLYFEKTFWIWFYNTFISFSLLNTDYQGSFLLPEISGLPIVLIASSGNII